jgi:hypothetical protein
MKRTVATSATVSLLCADQALGFSISNSLQNNLSEVDRQFQNADRAMN